VAERNPDQNGTPPGLIDELQSVSAALCAPDAAAAPQLDDIPVLLDVVDLTPASRRGAASAAGAPADPRAVLEIEAASLVDDLIDEFLPLVEARLRELLEERVRPLLGTGSEAGQE
jgi:hypothetical protein